MQNFSLAFLGKPFLRFYLGIIVFCMLTPAVAFSGEADLAIPDLSSVLFMNTNGRTLLTWGLAVCIFGFLFGFFQFLQIRNLKAHSSMIKSRVFIELSAS